MAKTIYESLQMDLPALAEILRRKGRGKDTILAHITPREAALLKKRGGSGTTNPDTGLPEYDDTYTDIGLSPDVMSQPLPSYQDTSYQQYLPTEPVAPTAPSSAPQVQETGTTITPVTTPSYAQGGEGLYTAPTGGVTGLLGAPETTIQPPLPTATYGGELAAKPDPSLLRQQLEKALSDPTNLAKLGVLGGLGIFGTAKAGQAARQGEAAAQEIQQIGQPYQAMGKDIYQQALTGQLTPANLQAYQAAKAKLEQDMASRGGVGAQQSAATLSNVYNTLLTNQLNQGLQIAGIGDQYQMQAIKTGLASDQALQQQLASLYANLAASGFGVPMAGTRTATTPTA
jgi:hypothetical protein